MFCAKMLAEIHEFIANIAAVPLLVRDSPAEISVGTINVYNYLIRNRASFRIFSRFFVQNRIKNT